MIAKLCPIMSSANYKIKCTSDCAFCISTNGMTTCTINASYVNSEEIKKKLDTIIIQLQKAGH